MIPRILLALLLTSSGIVACSSGDPADEAEPEEPNASMSDEELKAGKFACGSAKCTASQFCQITHGPGVRPRPGEPSRSFTRYACDSAPASCGSTAPKCSCIQRGQCRTTSGHAFVDLWMM